MSPQSTFRTFASPQRFLCPFANSQFPPTAPGTTDLLLVSKELPFLDIFCNWDHLIGGLLPRLLSLSFVGHPRAAGTTSAFLLLLSGIHFIMWRTMLFYSFMHSPDDGYCCYFCFLATLSLVAVIICLQDCLWTYVFISRG